MPTLYVRDVPRELYTRLKERAARERRSISQEALSLLEWALSEVEMEEALAQLIRRRKPSRAGRRAANSLTLRREASRRY